MKLYEFLAKLPIGWWRTISPRACQVLIEIASYSKDGETSQIPIKELALMCSTSHRTIDYAISELVEAEFLLQERGSVIAPMTYRPGRGKRTKRARSAAPRSDPDDPPTTSHNVCYAKHCVTPNAAYRNSPRAGASREVLTPKDQENHHHQNHHARREIRGGGGDFASSGGDDQAALDLLILDCHLTPSVAESLIRQHGAEHCVFEARAWKAQRNVGPGLLVTNIRCGAAHAKAKRKHEARERAPRRALEPHPQPEPATAPTEAPSDTGAVLAHIEAMNRADFEALCDAIIAQAETPFLRGHLERTRGEAMTRHAWRSEFARHLNTKTDPSAGRTPTSLPTSDPVHRPDCAGGTL